MSCEKRWTDLGGDPSQTQLRMIAITKTEVWWWSKEVDKSDSKPAVQFVGIFADGFVADEVDGILSH